MPQFWLIAKHEYHKTIGKRSFLATTLGIPLLIAVIMGFSIATAVRSEKDTPTGIVDQADIFNPGIDLPLEGNERSVALQPFSTEEEARAALEAGEIQAYFVLPSDYVQTRLVTLYYWDDAPSTSVQRSLETHLRASLAVDLPEQEGIRLVQRPQITVRSMDGARETSKEGFPSFVIPFAAGFFFVFSVMSSAEYLLRVVTDEKENRTVEIMVTSVSPESLIGGKALGLMGVALSQMALWLLVVAAGLLVGAQFLDAIREVKFPWDFLGIVALFFIPAYALIAGVMTAIGGSITEVRQGQQIAGILNMLFMLPYFFIVLIFANPNSPFLVGLTLFPTTAFVTITLRWGITVVPLWQMLASWVLLALSAYLSVLAAARIFRAGMLQYGKNLNLRAALRALQASR